MTTRVRSKSGAGIQLRLLGGTVYLKDGEETTLSDVQMTHNSIKNFLQRGVLVVVEAAPVQAPEPKTAVAVEDTPAKPVKAKGSKTKAVEPIEAAAVQEAEPAVVAEEISAQPSDVE